MKRGHDIGDSTHRQRLFVGGFGGTQGDLDDDFPLLVDEITKESILTFIFSIRLLWDIIL